MKPQIDVIEALRSANPVPPGVVDEAEPRSLEDILGSSLGRNDVMSSTTITRRDAEKTAPRWPRYLGAAAAVVVLIGGAGVLNRQSESNIAWADTPAERQPVIEQIVRAVNEGDQAGFVEAFAPGGTFTPWVNFVDFPPPHPVTDSALVETWMELNDVWGVEVELHSCAVERDTNVICEATIHYDTMRLDLSEEWLFVFGDSGLQSLGMLEVATEAWEFPREWETWLADNDPALLDRLGGGMDAPEPGFQPLTLNGIQYETQPFQYDPALADAIQASIDEYLATR
ncbi:MAG TPA: hypothetical protein VHL52_07180 [Acidimicrobiia bacterium]|nr:hypothetical protein [Acidimicrobiia bacterium]